MYIKSSLNVFAFAAILFSQASFGALPPLSQEQRESFSTDIVSGYVVSIKKKDQDMSYGSNRHYTVGMIVNKSHKGNNILAGSTFTFHYWKALDRENGWCGNGGQIGNIKHYQVIKAYLNFDEQTNTYNLLNPNGFDLVDL